MGGIEPEEWRRNVTFEDQLTGGTNKISTFAGN